MKVGNQKNVTKQKTPERRGQLEGRIIGNCGISYSATKMLTSRYGRDLIGYLSMRCIRSILAFTCWGAIRNVAE